eukprot:m.66933 g.66933  ORF g.66933 m.66933 type:complete len:115 (+) comp9840_c0_seq1:2997-3341(+)
MLISKHLRLGSFRDQARHPSNDEGTQAPRKIDCSDSIKFLSFFFVDRIDSAPGLIFVLLAVHSWTTRFHSTQSQVTPIPKSFEIAKTASPHTVTPAPANTVRAGLLSRLLLSTM